MHREKRRLTDLETQLETYSKIINSTNDLVKKWGGEIIIVYLPDAYLYAKKIKSPNLKYKNEILKIINNAKLQIIDISDLYKIQKELIKLLPLEMRGHLNSGGYKKVSEFIYKSLK